ncbi:MAG: CPBP family intramembrane metalloprotease [Firmicutes bacterium]|nr:CPBP family intramembrane metalloprotease [Bacillota bacterium]
MDEKLWIDPEYTEAVRVEQKSYRKDISRISWCLLIMQVVGNGLAICIVLALETVGMIFGGFGIEMETMSESVYTFVAGFVPTLLAEVMLIVLLRCWCGFRIQKEETLQLNNTWKMIGLSLLSGWGVTSFAIIGLSLFETLLNMIGLGMGSPNMSVPLPQVDMIGFILNVSYICVVGPVMEELIFRGFVLGGLKKYGEGTAIVVSAIMFTLFHGNLTQLITPLLMGLIFGMLTVRTGKLWPAIICHIGHNLLASFMGVREWAFLVYMGLGILGIILWWREYGVEILLLRKGGLLLKEDKVRGFLLAPGFWVFMAVYLLMCSMYFMMI